MNTPADRGRSNAAITMPHYNYYRDYDPGLGRYIESDPIGLRGGINTYGYVGNDPNARSDALGLAAMPFPGPFPGGNDPGAMVCAFHYGSPGCPPQPEPNPRTKCRIICNVKWQWICTGLGFGIGWFGTPAAGAATGGGCVLIKAVLCEVGCSGRTPCAE